MSGVLLDTSVLIWVLTDDRRLGAEARSRIDGADRCYFSAVSLLEVTIKSLLGKLHLPGDVAEASLNVGLTELPLKSVHAEALSEFPALVRHDPFDRMLLGQASVEGLVLLTSDETLLGLGLDWIVSAR